MSFGSSNLSRKKNRSFSSSPFQENYQNVIRIKCGSNHLSGMAICKLRSVHKTQCSVNCIWHSAALQIQKNINTIKTANTNQKTNTTANTKYKHKYTCTLYMGVGGPHKPYKSRQIRGGQLVSLETQRNRPTSCLMGMTLVFHTQRSISSDRKKADYACLENMNVRQLFRRRVFRHL